ncbi:MAG: hypothetical protein IPK82_00700 [Polyangiaceae bacterium]|nr:hypothetical protein [Polyangiaceae bacterium]
MDAALRRAYNASYSDETYNRYMHRLETLLGCNIPFRVAETPFFIPTELRDYLAKSAREIIDQISEESRLAKMKLAIPPALNVPRMDAMPNCVQVDFAIVRGPTGQLEGRVVELQAFPSLYALMVIQSDVMAETLREMPGMPKDFSIYFGGLNRETFIERFKKALLAGEDPEHVVLLDLNPPAQKTYPDFVATRMLTGVEAVCPTTLIKEGNKLFREKDGKKIQVRRIYNRIVFDELEVKGVKLPFNYTDDLDVTWLSHPNWYWTWSKFTLPFIDHPAVPKATYVSDLKEPPANLSGYVLKPLFSFAGSGVNIDPTHADLAAIPAEQRDKWILQEKITYEPGILMPDGTGVKAEVRMMFLRAPDEPKPNLVLNLVRLSRGKMLGVDQNKNLTWVGGTVGIWPA